jgi:DNA-binding transcriptional LysR family regulator
MALPDFEAWAIFAKVAELGSFNRAAEELGLSPATVSKAITRLEAQLGAPLFHRTSRRVTLTDSGHASLEAASRLLADAEQLETAASDQASAARGLVRMAAPVSFSIAHLGGLLPDFFALYPEVTVELSLDDAQVDLVEGGFDLALRIAALPDSSLLARRLCPVSVALVGSPAYFARHGRPAHPRDLSAARALVYTNSPQPGVWRFHHATHGDFSVSVPAVLKVNNADVMSPLLAAGVGIALQPDFLVWRDLADGRLEQVLPEWRGPSAALHLVTPPSPLRPRRVQALIDYLAARLTRPPWRSERAQTSSA